MFRAYDADSLTVGQVRFTTGLLIHHHCVDAPWGPESFSQLTVADLEFLLEQPPEVLVLGTGRLTRFPDETVMNWLHAQQIPYECMDSRAAARTYNILVGEGRVASCAMLSPGV